LPVAAARLDKSPPSLSSWSSWPYDIDVFQKVQPCINITFNALGGQLFGDLTGNHLPDRSSNFTYKLGIIMSGTLYSAPAIRSVILGNAQITGSFTDQQVRDLVDILNGGLLPVNLRLVEKKPSKP
jgi:preprotein translocase subunit SecD